ncbi:MAG: membrane protein insertase YidC [Alphaproteobacteria bacterium]|nr:membrane protein insertase YidC [Alphaproteobacteria bacterium]
MEQRNLILAIVLSLAILVGFQFLFPPPAPVAPVQKQTTEEAATPAAAPAATGVPAAAPPVALTRDEALTRGPRVAIDSTRLSGSLSLQGGRIDDLQLRDYRETQAPGSPQVVLLSPPGTPNAYYGEFGWIAGAGTVVALPGPDTVWTATGGTLGPNAPVTLTWDNAAGLRFVRTVRVDENYLFTINDKVENTTGAAVTLYPYGLVSRTGTPKTLGYYILHEGPLGVLDQRLVEVDYGDLQEGGAQTQRSTKGGWLGITDKYWLVAAIPDQAAPFEAAFRYAPAPVDKYQTDFRRDATMIPAGGSAEVKHMLFAGAKEVATLEAYRDDLGVSRFDLAIDWGWFFFLTKPIFLAIDYLYRAIGNFGVAIIVFTMFMRLLFFPLANKSFKSMAGMRQIQPEVVRVRELYANDRERQTREIMELYKRAKVNPLSGCIPILLQIPVFFALYKVLFVTIEMRHAPFYGWIKDLSAPDPTNLFNLFGLIPWDPQISFLHVGILPIIMGISMFVQQKLNPAPPDPIQQKMFMFLPVIFTFVLAGFPAGLVIYWTANNILSMGQQWIIIRRTEAASLPPKT